MTVHKQKASAFNKAWEAMNNFAATRSDSFKKKARVAVYCVLGAIAVGGIAWAVWGLLDYDHARTDTLYQAVRVEPNKDASQDRFHL